MRYSPPQHAPDFSFLLPDASDACKATSRPPIPTAVNESFRHDLLRLDRGGPKTAIGQLTFVGSEAHNRDDLKPADVPNSPCNEGFHCATNAHFRPD